MQKSDSTGQLFAALAIAQGEIEGAVKDAKNPHFRSSYATLAAVWEACRSALSKQSLGVIQAPGTDEQGLFLDTIIGHKSGEWISSKLYVRPVKDDPQGIGSAITYARRYSLAAMVGVSPEDDDGEGAMGRGKDTPKKDLQSEKDAMSEAAATIKNWKDVVCHIGTKAKGKKLSTLDTDTLSALKKHLTENASSKEDRKLQAAVEMALLELFPAQGTKSAHKGGKSSDEIPMSHAKDSFVKLIEWNGFSGDDYIALAHKSGWVPAEKGFNDLTEEDFRKMNEDAEAIIIPALEVAKKGGTK